MITEPPGAANIHENSLASSIFLMKLFMAASLAKSTLAHCASGESHRLSHTEHVLFSKDN